MSVAEPRPPDSLPRLLGGYQLLERIGEASGQGAVYRAMQVSCGREVAVKELAGRIDGDEFVRFQREARITAGLEHPHIVRLYDSGRCDDGRPFLVMELLRGPTAAALAKREGPLPLAAACEVVRQAAHGLQHAHDKGIVHRDIKPGNLMFDAGGAVKVLDFGLARGGSGDPTAGLTCTFTAMGTPHYMAPEQAGSARDADARADLYSMGCVLFALLTGRPPFGADSADYVDILAAHRRDPRPDVRAWRPEADERLAALLVGLLARDRGRRAPATAAQLAEALAAWADPAALARVLQREWAAPPPARTVGLLTTREDIGRTWAEELVNALGMRLRMLPAGRFLMGSPPDEEGRFDDEGPRHEVVLTRPAWLGVTPVTVGQFRAFAEATGYRTEAERGGGASNWTGQEWEQDAAAWWASPGFAQGDDHPVTCVSWDDAAAFAEWLSAVPRERAAGRRYRLPTEAEWEYACRAGALAYQPFHTGAALGEKDAHFAGRSRGTAAVGQYPANAWGLYDLHGNVWEWCADWYASDSYGSGEAHDPSGPAAGAGRVFRGGSWCNQARRCRSANRNRLAPASRNNTLGFRVVAVPLGGDPEATI